MQGFEEERPHEQCQLILSSSSASYASPLVAAQMSDLAAISHSTANLDARVYRISLVRAAQDV